MSNLYLGIDTSNYTTSIAITDSDGKVYADERIILKVKEGQRGLRQSDAFFQHIQNLPGLYEKAIDAVLEAGLNREHIKGISVSTRPRNVEGSYMPVFTAGENFARVISKTLDIPIYRTSHQEGHIKAIEAFNNLGDSFICFHISGGTMELLKVDKSSDYKFQIEIIGKSLDLSIGQLIDRVGVAMGYNFPCGAAMDKDIVGLNIKFDKKVKLGGNPIKDIPVKNMEFNLSGIETQIVKYIESKKDKDGKITEEIKNETLQLLFTKILLCLQKLVDKCKIDFPNHKIVFAGGVSQSRYIKENISGAIIFGKYGADNAVGVALLAAAK